LDEVIYGDYDSIINSAHEMAKSCQAKAIVLFSESGFSARLVSHHRPNQLIIVGTHNFKTYNQMAMLWGARAYYFEKKEREEMIEDMIAINKNAGRLQAGDKVVVILGKTPGAKDIALIGIRIVE
jgi:pyruvate kinase